MIEGEQPRKLQHIFRAVAGVLHREKVHISLEDRVRQRRLAAEARAGIPPPYVVTKEFVIQHNQHTAITPLHFLAEVIVTVQQSRDHDSRTWNAQAFLAVPDTSPEQPSSILGSITCASAITNAEGAFNAADTWINNSTLWVAQRNEIEKYSQARLYRIRA
jgi:hypothetical protein